MGCSHIQKGGIILTTVNDVDTTDDDSTNNTSQDESLILLEHLVHFTNRLIPENCIVERCSSVDWKEETKQYSDQGGSVGLDHGTQKFWPVEGLQRISRGIVSIRLQIRLSLLSETISSWFGTRQWLMRPVRKLSLVFMIRHSH